MLVCTRVKEYELRTNHSSQTSKALHEHPELANLALLAAMITHTIGLSVYVRSPGCDTMKLTVRIYLAVFTALILGAFVECGMQAVMLDFMPWLLLLAVVTSGSY